MLTADTITCGYDNKYLLEVSLRRRKCNNRVFLLLANTAYHGICRIGKIGCSEVHTVEHECQDVNRLGRCDKLTGV